MNAYIQEQALAVGNQNPCIIQADADLRAITTSAGSQLSQCAREGYTQLSAATTNNYFSVIATLQRESTRAQHVTLLTLASHNSVTQQQEILDYLDASYTAAHGSFDYVIVEQAEYELAGLQAALTVTRQTIAQCIAATDDLFHYEAERIRLETWACA